MAFNMAPRATMRNLVGAGIDQTRCDMAADGARAEYADFHAISPVIRGVPR